MSTLILFAIGLVSAIPFFYDHWRNTQAAGLALLLAFILRRVLRLYGLIPYVAMVTAIITGLYVAYFGDQMFLEERFSLGTVAAEGVIVLVVFSLIASHPEIFKRKDLCWMIPYLGLIDSFILLARWFVNGTHYGMLNNSAFDGSFIACCYPLLLGAPTLYPGSKGAFNNAIDSIVCFMIPLCAIVVSDASTPLFVLAATISGWWFATNWRNFAKYALPFYAGALITFYFLQKSELFDSRGRTEVWSDSWTMFHAWPAKWLFGFGTGTFEIHIPAYQYAIKRPDLFLWAHNEFVQILFEQGVIGIIGFIALLYKTAMRTLKRPFLFSSVCGILLTFMTQMPLRYLPFQILCVAVLLLSLEGDKAIELE